MAKKRGKIIQFVKFREPHKAEDGVRTSEEMDANPRSETLIQMPRKRRQSLHHWTFKGWVAPSPFLTEIMRSPVIAPPTLRGTAMLESGVLAYRRRKNGEVLILLVSKKRSKKWGIPKGRVNASLSFGETAAKEAYEEAGVMGRISPNSIGILILGRSVRWVRQRSAAVATATTDPAVPSKREGPTEHRRMRCPSIDCRP